MKPPTSESNPEVSRTSLDVPSPRTVVAVVGLVAAAWILSGGCGLLGRPLAGGLTWCALAVISVAQFPKRQTEYRTWTAFGFGLATAVLATAAGSELVRLAGLAVYAATLSIVNRDSLDRRLVRIATLAIAVLAIYRFSLKSIPIVWHVSEALGSTLGSLSTFFWGHPLSVGATFAGLDHLVVMTVFVVAWAFQLQRPRLRAVSLAVSAVVIGHALYLLCLSLSVDLARMLPAAPVVPTPDPYVPPDWFWGNAIRSWLPWNVPVLAALWHLSVIAAMLRLGKYRTNEPTVARNSDAQLPKQDLRLIDWQIWTPVAAAALLPLVCVLSIGKSDLREKTVLVFNRGYLDWDVPVHDRYGADSSGRFGMLPAFVESLGGRLKRSSELTSEELSRADVLVLIHPNQPWSDELLSRVRDYVRQGGSLLVAAGPRLQDSQAASSYNEVLEPLDIPVRFDMAISQTEAWRHALQTAAHPAALGLGNDRDRFNMTAAASIRLPWRASPLLVGRWGWSDPGSDFFLTGTTRWDAGERLGDLVLAAERRFGAGRVVVLGDNGCLTNQGNVRAYRFTGRLLAYLAQRAGSPQAWWRQFVGLILTVGMVVLWCRSNRGDVLAVSLLTLIVVFSIATKVSCRSWEVLPDGRDHSPNNVAYLDASHLEAYSESPWSPDGVDGLALTLMRDGYLVLAADDLSEKRLQRAGMLVSIAPARPFTGGERRRIKRFVENGGALIAMAGAMDARNTNRLFEQFGLQIPPGYRRPGSSGTDAKPLGCHYWPYPDGSDSPAAVVFHAAWPIVLTQSAYPTTSLVSAAIPGRQTGDPIVAISNAGEGAAILIADTRFAMNRTLEDQDGATLTGDRVCANFWRWLIGRLPGHEPWQPPPYKWGSEKSQPNSTPTGAEEAQP